MREKYRSDCLEAGQNPVKTIKQTCELRRRVEGGGWRRVLNDPQKTIPKSSWVLLSMSCHPGLEPPPHPG